MPRSRSLRTTAAVGGELGASATVLRRPQKGGVCAARAGMAVSMRKFSVEVAQNGEVSAPANLADWEVPWGRLRNERFGPCVRATISQWISRELSTSKFVPDCNFHYFLI